MRIVTDPKVGDRVVPGPDWITHWVSHIKPVGGNIATGEGVITGVRSDNAVAYVKWDAGQTGSYYTGYSGKFRLAYAPSLTDLMHVLKL